MTKKIRYASGDSFSLVLYEMSKKMQSIESVGRKRKLYKLKLIDKTYPIKSIHYIRSVAVFGNDELKEALTWFENWKKDYILPLWKKDKI